MTSKKTYQDPYAKREANLYDNPVPSRELILQVLNDQARPLFEQELVALLNITDDASREAFGYRIRAMLRDGQLRQNRTGRLGPIDRMNLIAGRVEEHKGGYGFVIPDDGSEDLFLPPHQLKKVMHGDKVLVHCEVSQITGRKDAHVLEITQRALTHLVGRFHRDGQLCWLVSTSKNAQVEAIVADLNGFAPKEDDHLRAEIITYPSGQRPMQVKLVEHIASPDDRGMEIEVALRSFDLPFEWPVDVTKQANSIAQTVPAKDAKQRFDLRDLPLVTIDGEDARDFDDAVYVQKRPRGGWRLIVAIADVSHYVPLGTPLDQQAHLRGTSVYFPSRVIPMLPEALSNGICSLNPDVDRLCLCCDMQISAAGRVTQFVFREGVMRSHQRLTYTQVSSFLDEGPNAANKTEFSGEVAEQLIAFHELYHALREQREQRGAIDFESHETQVLFDEQLKIKAIIPRTRNVAHMMIEEAMLAANVSAARLLSKSKLPALYRNHEGPKDEKLSGLQQFLAPLGVNLEWDGKSKPTPALFQALSKQIAERPDRGLIELVMLRTLKQAKYESECKGHFGLAYEYYTHFTSPIRRYPDLLVHRAIRYLIRQGNSKQVENTHALPEIKANLLLPASAQQVIELGEHCSMTERRADDASRDVEQWLKCQFMEQHIGSTFSGTISGVTGFGLFVEIDDLRIDGLIHIATLGDDYFIYDAQHQLLKGQASGYRFRLGDRVEVRLAAVIVDERKIDLELVGHEPYAPNKKNSQKLAAASKAKKKSITKTKAKAPNQTKADGGKKAHGKKVSKGPPRGKKAARRKASR